MISAFAEYILSRESGPLIERSRVEDASSILLNSLLNFVQRLFDAVAVAEGCKQRAGQSDFGVKRNDPWTTLITLIFRLHKRTWH